MEPFELKLHQVTFEENNKEIIGQSQAQELSDSFSLVHYDECFKVIEDRTKSAPSVETNSTVFSLSSTVGEQGPRVHNSVANNHRSDRCNSPEQDKRKPNPVVPKQVYPWEVDYAGDGSFNDHYLINPDDNFYPAKHPGKISPESAAAGLQTLSQVSFNTTAVSKHIKKLLHGKRRIAKTTLISTSLATPRTMPSETSSSAVPPSPSPSHTPGPENDEGADKDSSFETVAEALRLQWSVIGNSNITPASPEEVAKIVAEAEKRLKSGALTPSSSHPPVKSAAALGSGEPSLLPFPAATSSDVSGRQTPTELIRIHSQSITREVERPSLFGSRVGNQDILPDMKAPILTREKLSDVTNNLGEVDHAARNNLDNAPISRVAPLSVFSDGGDGQNSYSGFRSVNTDQSFALQDRDTHVPSKSVSQQDVQMPFGTRTSAPSFLNSPSYQTIETVSTPFSQSGSFPSMNTSQHILHQQNMLPVQQSSVSGNVAQPPKDLSLLTSATSPLPPSLITPPLQSSTPVKFNLSILPKIGPLFPPKSTGFASPAEKLTIVFKDNVSTGKASGVLSPSRPGRAVTNMAEGHLQDDGSIIHKKYEELLLEKVKLEGQLEVLGQEAESAMQERAELQAQLASLQLKLNAIHSNKDDVEKVSLRSELDRLRKARLEHEKEVSEVQQLLEEKMEELKVITEDLYQSQDISDKLQVRMKELRDDLQAKEVTVQALKGKIAELYVEVQTTLQSKMESDAEARTARNDLAALVKAKEWYQEQLSIAHEVRAKLQRQLTSLQAQTVSQSSIVERLKLESTKLRQQLRESQERALRDKEQLARHLETIQNDMMEREAAFQEIQRERLMIEDTFNTQVSTVEEEKSRISSLLQLTAELEMQLEQAHSSSKKKQELVFSLENEQMEMMKKVALSQEALLEKDQALEDLNQKLIEVESELEAFHKILTTKDAELLRLREDKASTEIALKSALAEKASVDQALDTLKADMGKVEKSFKQMRQELGTRLTELQVAQNAQKAARDQLDRVTHELDIKNRSVDALTHDREQHLSQIQELLSCKALLEEKVSDLKMELEQVQISKSSDLSSTQVLQEKLQETRAHLVEVEANLQAASVQLQKESDIKQQSTSGVPDEQLQEVLLELDNLKHQLVTAKQENLQEEERHKQETQESDLQVKSLQSQLAEERTEFEKKLQSQIEQLRHVSEQKHRLETELEMTQRKFDLSSVQQQDQIREEIQNLMSELQAVHLQKQDVENQLHALQAEKDAEIQALQNQLAETLLSLQSLTDVQDKWQDTEQLRQQLALELEKERGRIAGLQQSNATLKEHMKHLEEVLAGRESSLTELNSFLQSTTQEYEKEQQESLRRIQGLEQSLQKEKDATRDLRKQIGSKITENKRLLKQQEAHKKEQAILQEEVQQHQEDSHRLQANLESARQSVRDHQGELQTLQTEKRAVEAELERVKRELVDSADRNPVLLDQIQNLEWQLSQKNQEVDAAKEQLALAEQRQAAEMESMQRALQDKQEEIESLQAELAAVRQEKADQKSRVSELRSVLKASVQHHKLTKKLNSRKKEKGEDSSLQEKGTQANLDNGVIIPPLPFSIEVVEQLLQDTAVRPLDSKPLDNLSTCLSSLRAEISGLQKQMEVHATMIHSSTHSWRSVETEVKGLQEVVRSIANTIMDVPHTSTVTTTTAADTEQVEDSDVIHI